MVRSWLSAVTNRLEHYPSSHNVPVCYIPGAGLHRQLQWGVGGAGGSGTWNATNLNWWDGANNVAWNSGVANFGGTAGTVTSVFPGQSASRLVFNVPGYELQEGWINGSLSGLTIVTNADATIGSTLYEGSGFPLLVKTGAGKLTVTGTNQFDLTRIEAGEYRVGGNSSLFFSDVVLADSAGVTVTLGNTFGSVSFRSLSGGGATGGIVQPDNQARTVTATVFNSGTFQGRLQDNGSGKLAFDAFGSAIQTLTGTNTHSGETTAIFGTIVLSGNGSVLNSPVSPSTAGTVRLDNSATVLANRLSDSLDLTLEGGTLALIGHSSTAVEEMAGNLRFSGSGKIAVTQPGALLTQLTFAGSSRIARGTLDVSGPGVRWSGITNSSGALIAAHVTAGAEWATVGGDGRITSLAAYASDINTGGPNEDVKLSGGGSFTLSSPATRNSLNLQNSSGATGTLDLSGHALTLASGGLLTSGSSASAIGGGTLRSNKMEIVVTNRNALSIGAVLDETIAGTGLTKSGTGVLTLSGNNTFTGNIAINEGSLVVASDANLGLGSAIEFNGGKLTAGASFTSNKALTRGTPLIGTIDTAGHNVVFSGQNLAAVSKLGAGTLTLTHSDAGNVSATQGTVVLPNATSGVVRLQGGTLQAKGTLSSIELSTDSRLDLGGSVAATLTIDSYAGSGGVSPKLTIDFGIGSGETDLWTINSSFSGSIRPGFVLFDFDDLGGLMTGIDYTLISFPGGTSVSPSTFALSPNLVTAGWDATFSVVSSTLKVQFSQIPEPGIASLLYAGLSWLAFSRRSRRASDADERRYAMAMCSSGGVTRGLPGETDAGGVDAFARNFDANGNTVWTTQFATCAARPG